MATFPCRKVSRVQYSVFSIQDERDRKNAGDHRTADRCGGRSPLVWFGQELAGQVAGRYQLQQREFQFSFSVGHVSDHQRDSDVAPLALPGLEVRAQSPASEY